MAAFAVTTLADTGPGSFRRAILDANARPGPDAIEFQVAGTIPVARRSLPAVTGPVTIDGTTAPEFAGAPRVTVDFRGTRGLRFARGADGSTLRSLALVRAGDAGVTIDASRVTVQGNYIGLLADGRTPAGNRGDGIRINPRSRGNLIGRDDPVTGVTYYDASAVGMQPVSGWQGIRAADSPGQYMITGTSNSNGLLYVGPITGAGGASYSVNVPGAASTSVYGPDNLAGDAIRLVGSYRSGEETVLGFVFEGTTADLANPANYRTIAQPGAKYNYVHSTMGGLAVGNYDSPTAAGQPAGPGRAFIYDVASGTFVADVAYPGALSNTAYGIWHNGGTSYTICGGYSLEARNNFADPRQPIGSGYLVDYDSATGRFSNWTAFNAPEDAAGRDLATHFEGISSVERGVYTLNAGSSEVGTSPAKGWFVTVRRGADGSFGQGAWVDLAYPGATGATTSDSVSGNQVVGIAMVGSTFISYQATVDAGFQLSNVIAGNSGDGISIRGAHENVVAMNFIGTDATGTLARGNRRSGIRLTSGASRNRIGGQATGGNDPTGGVFVRPPQGNLISGNGAEGVLIDGGATRNVLSGNFIGTNASGNAALGNRRDGVAIVRADGNQLFGCSVQQDPFVHYNVLSGNGGNGLRITDSNDTTVHANFMGVGANNATLVPNAENGLLVSGRSANTQVGGVIPLGNVISGNNRHGIEVRDRATGFVSFNTFAGVYAFGGAAPNRGNGITITSTGGNNLVRTSIVSGNLGHGLEIGGRATGVQVTDTAFGTNTAIQTAIPNGGSGIVLSGQARGNAIGGFQPSIEPRVYASGNRRWGIEVVGQARDNSIFNTDVGSNASGEVGVPNGLGGILLGPGTRGTRIGGAADPFRVRVRYNNGPGLLIRDSDGNSLLGSEVQANAGAGVALDEGLNNVIGSEGAGNSIDGNGGDGVSATGHLSGSRVEANAIRGNGGNGVALLNARRIVIGGPSARLGNRILANRGFGIFAAGNNEGAVVENNVVADNGQGDTNA